MKPRYLWILAALALAGCGGNPPPTGGGESAADLPAAVEDTNPAPEAGDTAATTAGALATTSTDSGVSPTSARFQLGTHYDRLSPAQPTSSGPDKVEVTEVFWYGCPHCFAFDPYLEAWEAKKPDYVSFVRVPAVWNPLVRTHAQMFYTAEALGKGAELHEPLFREIHENHNMLDTPEKIQAFFGQHGVDAEAFKSAWESFAVHTKLQRADELSRRYRIQSVPTIVVNGKYTSDGGQAGSYDDLLALVGELVASEHAGK
jgi:thiol:disulfide interchange protein DsbA